MDIKCLQDDIAYLPSEDSTGHFTLDTGLEHDYACFALWNGALKKQQDILNDLQKHFEILADYEITWSEDFYQQNIDRLYERAMRDKAFHGWDAKIGPPPFRFVIVRDTCPKYTWKRSVSGVIEPSNESVVAAKYRYRDLFTAKYQVHSSNNIKEFLFQSALVLGPERLQAVLEKPVSEQEELQKDLEGAGGWDSWKQLFDVLNIGSKYLVQRNFEGLPDQLIDKDIDFLCDNYQKLAALSGMKPKKGQPYKGKIAVKGKNFSVDIRFTGDGYLPSVWQEDMLRRRQILEGFYVPAPDDLFFSVLFHCKVQKREVKPKYITDLSTLAQELRFDWFDGVDLTDDSTCGSILNGYFRARSYYYEVPMDKGVQQNMSVIRLLPSSPIGGLSAIHGFRRQLIIAIRNPKKAQEFLFRKIKSFGKKSLGR